MRPEAVCGVDFSLDSTRLLARREPHLWSVTADALHRRRTTARVRLTVSHATMLAPRVDGRSPFVGRLHRPVQRRVANAVRPARSTEAAAFIAGVMVLGHEPFAELAEVDLTDGRDVYGVRADPRYR